ncbi:MAG: agmatine deiminase [Bifidobacteriaceae bacterium]|jgi:agmatine deiminase|nr:agmatine deiminase [Bifidobacteriaceae bacterium]
MNRLSTIPVEDGFHMPGEFEPHDGCWLLWPERPDNWRLGAKPAQAAFAEVARAIAEFEPVTVGVSAAQYDNAVNQLGAKIRVVEISNNDSWVRDCGPTFVKNAQTGEIRGVDWVFNAWGGLHDGLYFPWDKDDQVARKICEIERIASYRVDGFVLEGGSIHSDGEGTVYTTEECLLSPGRNPELTKAQIEDKLRQHIGAEKVIWLKRGIFLDETNGHVDNICCPVKPGAVLLAWTDDESDPQHAISRENLEILLGERDARGREIEVVKLRLPQPILITAEESQGVDAVEGTLPRVEGDRLAASYVNFYIANGAIVAPSFGDPADKAAVDTLATAFPGRKIVTVPAREILLGGGNIHCITQQQPAAGAAG